MRPDGPSAHRYKKLSEGLQTEVEIGRREAEALRSKLQAARDDWKEVVGGVGGAREEASVARYGHENDALRDGPFFCRRCRRLFW